MGQVAWADPTLGQRSDTPGRFSFLFQGLLQGHVLCLEDGKALLNHSFFTFRTSIYCPLSGLTLLNLPVCEASACGSSIVLATSCFLLVGIRAGTEVLDPAPGTVPP